LLVDVIQLRLLELATELRRGLLTCPKHEGFSPYLQRKLKDFPKDCCEITSRLLAYYLRDNGFQHIEIVCGCVGLERHVWLEVDGRIVDVTADQFQCDPVIVVPLDGCWYSKLDEAWRNEEANDTFKMALEQAYSVLRAWLNVDVPPPSPKM
jgi:hypothetical protein